MLPLHPVVQDENYPDQVTQHGQDNDYLDSTEGIIQKSSDFPEHREWVCYLYLIKWKPGIYPVYKGIEHYHKHGETEPGKKLEIPLHQEMTQVAERIDINLFQE